MNRKKNTIAWNTITPAQNTCDAQHSANNTTLMVLFAAKERLCVRRDLNGAIISHVCWYTVGKCCRRRITGWVVFGWNAYILASLNDIYPSISMGVETRRTFIWRMCVCVVFGDNVLRLNVRDETSSLKHIQTTPQSWRRCPQGAEVLMRPPRSMIRVAPSYIFLYIPIGFKPVTDRCRVGTIAKASVFRV